MRDCPKCGKVVDGLECGFCGYSEERRDGKDPLHLRCENVYQGQRCAELGTLSENLRGGGPWFCYKHFPLFAGRHYCGKPQPPPQGFKALKDVLSKVK